MFVMLVVILVFVPAMQSRSSSETSCFTVIRPFLNTQYDMLPVSASTIFFVLICTFLDNLTDDI
jgi:hypothetical protein